MTKQKLNSRDLAEVKQYIKSLKNEMSTTSGVAAYSTPKAFNSDKDAEGSKILKKDLGGATAYTEKPSKKKPKSFDIIKVNESSYKDFKNDPSGTSVQKVNNTINEINKRLREVNKMLNHSIKLKTESNMTSNLYWKKTLNNITKIDEQLVIISNKLRKLSE